MRLITEIRRREKLSLSLSSSSRKFYVDASGIEIREGEKRNDRGKERKRERNPRVSINRNLWKPIAGGAPLLGPRSNNMVLFTKASDVGITTPLAISDALRVLLLFVPSAPLYLVTLGIAQMIAARLSATVCNKKKTNKQN